jgi:hypothetical protein
MKALQRQVVFCRRSLLSLGSVLASESGRRSALHVFPRCRLQAGPLLTG